MIGVNVLDINKHPASKTTGMKVVKPTNYGGDFTFQVTNYNIILNLAVSMTLRYAGIPITKSGK